MILKPDVGRNMDFNANVILIIISCHWYSHLYWQIAAGKSSFILPTYVLNFFSSNAYFTFAYLPLRLSHIIVPAP